MLLWILIVSSHLSDHFVNPPSQWETTLQRLSLAGYIHKMITYIFLQYALRWMPHVLADDKSTLVQVMAWLPTGDKQLAETMMTIISVIIRPQWVNIIFLTSRRFWLVVFFTGDPLRIVAIDLQQLQRESFTQMRKTDGLSIEDLLKPDEEGDT